MFLRRGFHILALKGNVTSPKRVIMLGQFSYAFGMQDALRATEYVVSCPRDTALKSGLIPRGWCDSEHFLGGGKFHG